MSLKISENWKKDRKWYRDKKNPITAYKVLNNNQISIFRGYDWKLGLNISDRYSIYLENHEISRKKVDEGFHLYTRKDDAYRGAHINNLKVMECLVYPEDIVAVGTSRGRKMMVTTQAIMVGPVKRRPGKKQ